MARKRHSAEEIVNKLRQAEVELGKGSSVATVCKLLRVTEQTLQIPLGRRDVTRNDQCARHVR